MGVLGLWRLLDATGKPVPLETLEGKVLAIDISIWIHQVIQGYQDRRGNAVPNAHLIGLFNRLCKLMYFKIKPIFVFDGGVPLLKKNTIATRRKLKSAAASKAQKLKNDLINNLIKHAAVTDALDKDNNEKESATEKFKDSTAIPSTSGEIDIYKLPKLLSPQKPTNPEDYIDSDDEDLLQHSPHKHSKWMGNIHSVDVDNSEFHNLPADVRYDILTDLKETRKQNSWGRIHELPAGSDNYAGFQMKRLLKRRYVQESLEKAEKEMGGRTLTIEELDKLLTEQGINTMKQDDAVYRIASDSTTRVLFADKPLSQNSIKTNEGSDDSVSEKKSKKVEENMVTNDSDSMSVQSDNSVSIVNDLNAYDFDDWYSDDDFDDSTLNENSLNESHVLPKSSIPKSAMNPALAYMLEHSGFTRDQVLKIVDNTKKNKQKSESNSSSSSKTGKKLKQSSILNKKRDLFRSLVRASPKMKKKASDDSNIPAVTKSDSKNETEISEKFDNEIKEHDAESDSEHDDFVEILDESENKNLKETNGDPDKTITMDSSDSGSDDFVEVENVAVPESLVSKKIKNSGFQIIINSNEEPKEDIFADVFNDHQFKEEDTDVKDTASGFQITLNSNEELKEDIFVNVFNDHELKKEDTGVKGTSPLYKAQVEGLKKKHSTFEKEQISGISIKDKTSPSDDKSDFLVSSSGKISPSFQTQSSLSSPTKHVSSLEILDDTSDLNTVTKKMTPEEILKQIKSTLQRIKTVDDEKDNETLIFNTEQMNSEMLSQTNFPKETIEEVITPKNNEISEKNEEAFSNDAQNSSENVLQADVIEELFRDEDFGESSDVMVEKEIIPPVLPQDEKELESMKQQLESEQQQIAGSLGKLERQAIDITDQMRIEAQELLRLFGYPYIVAPMEAEAQCAYLEQIKLTDGTVTDDSDVWLFGGRCVYKNFFDNNKKVLQFLSADIKHHYNLSRKEMILLALLVGSDYTNGLAGVGPVTALEILASFPTEGEDILRGLRSFCSWLRAGKIKAPTKISLRNKLKNVQIEKGFPSQAVVQAYMCPMVDESAEAFSWGKPNLTLLVDYVKQKFGWTKLKFEEIMNPILKRLNESKSQKVLESYFKVQLVPKSIESAMSKRVQNAVQKLSGKDQDDDNPCATSSKIKKQIEKIKKPRKTAVRKKKNPKNDSDDLPASVDSNKTEGMALADQKIVEDSATTSTEPRGSQIPQNDVSHQSKKVDTVEEIEHSDENKVKRRKICIGHETDDIIPQRERDKVNALKTKLKAIEIYRKSKIGSSKVKKTKKRMNVKKDAGLSESSDSN